jgi:hypothetical protein
MIAMIRTMLVLGLMTIAAPVYASQAVQIFLCEEEDGVTEEKLEATASNWLKAARTMKGGANLEAYIHYPIAAKIPGEGDFMFVIVAPSLAEWGMFWDGYKDSPAEEADGQSSGVSVCPDSALWEAVKIK